MTATIRAAVGLAVIGLAGCDDKPRAPALTREAVYQNDAVGLRFAAPDGWTVHSKADLPNTRLPKPVVLVGYVSPKGEVPAQFQVQAADAVADADLEAFVTANPVGEEKWATKGPPAQVTINGVGAVRVTLTRNSKRGEVLREVTMFRRGERSFLFLITYGTFDRDARDQAHQCIAGVQWK